MAAMDAPAVARIAVALAFSAEKPNIQPSIGARADCDVIPVKLERRPAKPAPSITIPILMRLTFNRLRGRPVRVLSEGFGICSSGYHWFRLVQDSNSMSLSMSHFEAYWCWLACFVFSPDLAR